MKNKKEKPDILTIKIGRTNYRALVIAFICSVAFMLFITEIGRASCRERV